jgi:2,3-bisphosphoglycerate-independent phosphoglycerate mutase
MAVFDKVKSKNGRLHFLGLVSDGGVHSHITHLEALLTAAKQAGVSNTYVQFFSDGRDTSPVSGGGRGMTLHNSLNIILAPLINTAHVYVSELQFSVFVTVTYVGQVVDYLASIGYGSLATLMGRYYAMDRDKRYERTKIAYEGLTKGVGEAVPVNQLIQVRNTGWITNCIT